MWKNDSWYFHWCQSPHEETFSTWKIILSSKCFSSTCELELQRMFEHSNIIRLRFSRTNFFANERSLTPVGLFLAHTLRSEAPVSRIEAMYAWPYSWNLALTLVMSGRAAEKEAVTWTFNLKRSMKDNPSKVSSTFLVAEILSLFCARHRVLWPQGSQRQVTLEEVSCSVLFGWSQVRQNRSWKGLLALRVLSALFAVKSAYTYCPATPTLLPQT